MQSIMKLRGRLLGAAVAGLAASGAATAYGDTVTTVDGPLNLSGPSTFNTGLSYSDDLGPGYLVDENSLNYGVSALGSSGTVIDYQFTLGSGFSASSAPPQFTITYSNNFGSYVPVGGSVSLIDVTDSNSILASVSGTGGAISLSHLLWTAGTGASHIGDTFEVALSLPAGFKGAIEGVGSVPIPGALLLFGSALAGLGAFGARRRKSGPVA